MPEASPPPMTARIVTTIYRYKPPPKRRKPVARSRSVSSPRKRAATLAVCEAAGRRRLSWRSLPARRERATSSPARRSEQRQRQPTMIASRRSSPCPLARRCSASAKAAARSRCSGGPQSPPLAADGSNLPQFDLHHVPHTAPAATISWHHQTQFITRQRLPSLR